MKEISQWKKQTYKTTDGQCCELNHTEVKARKATAWIQDIWKVYRHDRLSGSPVQGLSSTKRRQGGDKVQTLVHVVPLLLKGQKKKKKEQRILQWIHFFILKFVIFKTKLLIHKLGLHYPENFTCQILVNGYYTVTRRYNGCFLFRHIYHNSPTF